MKSFFFPFARAVLLSTGLFVTGQLAQAQAPAWQTAVSLSPGTGSTAQVEASVATAAGLVYVSGSFRGTVTLGSTTLTSAGTGENVFVAKWNPAGTGSFAWAVAANADAAGGTRTALAVSGPNVYLGGSFVGPTATFGSTTLANANPASTFQPDGFVAKLLDVGPSASFAWAVRVGGADFDRVTGLAATGNGVYLAGYFYTAPGITASFGTQSLTSAGGDDGFVARLVERGGGPPTFQWALRLGGAQNDQALALVVGPGNIFYVAGSFQGTAAFGTQSLTSAGADDAFVARYTDGGGNANSVTTTWARRAGGPGNDQAQAVAAAGQEVYVAGYYGAGTATFGTESLTSAGSDDAFVARLREAGATTAFSWARSAGGTGPDRASALALNLPAVYVAGSFSSATMAVGSITLTNAAPGPSPLANRDGFVARLTDGGTAATFDFARSGGGLADDVGNAVAVSGRQVYLGGSAVPPASFDALPVAGPAGSKTGFLAGLTDPAPLLTLAAPGSAPAGATITLYGANLTGTTSLTFSGTANNTVSGGFTVNAAGTQISGVVVPAGAVSGGVIAATPRGPSNFVPFAVAAAPNPAPTWQSAVPVTSGVLPGTTNTATDASGNRYVAFSFTGTVALGSSTLTSAGGVDVYVAKLAANGSYLWVQQFGGPGDEYGARVAANGSSVYVAGVFNGPTATIGTTTLNNLGLLNGFVAKLTDAGSSASFGWAVRLGGTDEVYTNALAVSGSSVYVGGDFTSPVLTVAGGSVTRSSADDDVFVVKLTDTGSSAAFGWGLHSSGGQPGESPSAYALAAQGGSVFVTGVCQSALTLGSTTLPDAQNANAFVAKITDAGAAGSFAWALQAGGTRFDYANQVAVQGRNVYIAGSFTSTQASFGTSTLTNVSRNTSDVFVAKLVDAGSSASFAWAQSAGGPGFDRAFGLSFSGTTVYVSGSVTPPAAFGTLAILNPAGTSIAFLATLTDLTLGTVAPAADRPALAVWPNPAHGTATVRLPAGSHPTFLTLLDALGREVRRYPAPAGTEATLDLRGLPAGVYVLRHGSSSQRLVVE